MNSVDHLILSTTIDYSTDLICAELEKRGLKYLRMNRDHFSKYDILCHLQENVINVKLEDIWYELTPKALKSIYFRAPVFLRSTGKAYTLEEQLKRSQWSSFIRNLIILDDSLWINHPVAVYRAENKLYQLKIASECGMNVPDTYVGNSLPTNIVPEKAYIVKSLDTALFYDNGKEMFTYSTTISGQELMNSEIKSAPIILQEYLADKVDFRVTFINGHIYPVAIKKRGEPIYGDWRMNKKEDLEYKLVELPLTLKSKIINLMDALKLTFGGLDFALVDDTYYFIEVNPTGEWGWLASSVGLPIDKAIVDCMAGVNTYV